MAHVAAVDKARVLHSSIPKVAGLSVSEHVHRLTSIVEQPSDPLDIAAVTQSVQQLLPLALANERLIGRKRALMESDVTEALPAPKLLRIAERMRGWRKRERDSPWHQQRQACIEWRAQRPNPAVGPTKP